MLAPADDDVIVIDLRSQLRHSRRIELPVAIGSSKNGCVPLRKSGVHRSAVSKVFGVMTTSTRGFSTANRSAISPVRSRLPSSTMTTS